MIHFLSRLVLAIQGNGTSRLTFRRSHSAECVTPHPLESISLTESSRSSQMSCGFIIEQDTPLNILTYSGFWFCNLWQRVRRSVPCLQAVWLRDYSRYGWELYYAIHHTAFVLMTVMRIPALFYWIEIEYLVRAHRYRLSLTCKWLELSLPGTKCLEAGQSSGPRAKNPDSYA